MPLVNGATARFLPEAAILKNAHKGIKSPLGRCVGEDPHSVDDEQGHRDRVGQPLVAPFEASLVLPAGSPHTRRRLRRYRVARRRFFR
jgi:hypothetical protein